uniref:Glycerol-3-phosphate acyltransferase 2, mitochondrial n=1 Tax=Strigops habroptila TaxID=2489341 RepID=A0A672UNX6_STRHB
RGVGGDGRCDSQSGNIGTWVCVSGQRVEIVLPFLSKCRADSGRCCQTCTPMSWVRASTGNPCHGSVSLPRFRGWLVRRVCALLAVCSWEVPADTPGDLAARVCRSRSFGSSSFLLLLLCPGGETEAGNGVAVAWGCFFTPCFSCRICHWALLKLLSRLFLSVQLTPHVPLVFLSTHKSQLDGPLLSFVLFSQGLGVPRVTWVPGCLLSPCRSLLRRLGGIFLPSRMEQTPSDPEDALPGAVLAAVGAPWGRGAQPLSIGACLWAAFRALRRNLGCVRVDFAQPFSLQHVLLRHHVRGDHLRAAAAQIPGGEAKSFTSRFLFLLEQHSQRHAGSLLLILLFLQGVFLSRLMRDFAWLLEEILLRQHDVGFSGQLRVLVQHSLILLRARLSLYHLSPLGDILVVPKASAETWMELGQHSAAILPVFASEAVGACAIRALLAEMLPFLEPPTSASSIIFSQDELHRKTLELLRLLPPTLLGLGPAAPRLSPQAEGEHWVCDTAPRPFSRRQPWPRMDFSDSESEDEAPACRCFKVPAVGGSPLSPPRGEGALPELRVPPVQLGEPQGSPLFLLFLCRLLSPALRTYAGAVAFLEQSRWPQPGESPPGWETAPPAPPNPASLMGKLRQSRSSLCSPALGVLGFDPHLPTQRQPTWRSCSSSWPRRVLVSWGVHGVSLQLWGHPPTHPPNQAVGWGVPQGFLSLQSSPTEAWP